QPHYDAILKTSEAWIFERTSALTRNIHPYHRDFILVIPLGNIGVAADRWAWITESPHGMWPKWAERHPEWGRVDKMPESERIRLVQLDLERELIPQRWAPVIDELLFPGAP